MQQLDRTILKPDTDTDHELNTNSTPDDHPDVHHYIDLCSPSPEPEGNNNFNNFNNAQQHLSHYVSHPTSNVRYCGGLPRPPLKPLSPEDEQVIKWSEERLYRLRTAIEGGDAYRKNCVHGSSAKTAKRNVTEWADYVAHWTATGHKEHIHLHD